jgi:hypothetical protein
MTFQPPVRNGRNWAFHFDVDVGVSAHVDGQVVGSISVADLRQLMTLRAGDRDIDLEANEILHRLQENTAFPEGEESFPSQDALEAAVTDWLNDQ